MSPHRTKWSRHDLIRHLEILGPLDTPLPPTLPPSPPTSRSASPVLGSKRKSDAAALHAQEHSKRPRTSTPSTSTAHLHPPHPHPSAADPPRALNATPAGRGNEPCEDGEVREDIPAPAYSQPQGQQSSVENSVPVRRPRRGVPGTRTCEQNHSVYYERGRKLKYSGDARHWSTFPTSNREYRSLPDPPPPNSPYHKHGGLIARLELVDALVCFAYALWNKDQTRHNCNFENWQTIDGFLGWCKTKWEKDGFISDDAERAFLGLIWMIEGFIHARKLVYLSKLYVDKGMDKLVNIAQSDILAATYAAEQKMAANPGGLKAPAGNPQMLPSPASIATSSSTTSTPTTRDEDSPSVHNVRNSMPPPSNTDDPTARPPIPSRLVPPRFKQSGMPPWAIEATKNITESIDLQLIGGLKDITAGLNAAGYSTTIAQKTLNLPVLARHFPQTFARMVHSSLAVHEEYEPDFEDEEGELLWPGQCVNGEGLGWVCLMGQAMIREFGQRYGYQGIKGVVPKPTAEEHRPLAPAPFGSSHASSSSFPPSAGHSLPARPTFPSGSR